MSWLYQGEVLETPPENCYGFVYKIINTTNGKCYIGKKFFWARRTKTLKGKKKRYLAESDWKKYYGSSLSLQKDIELLGVDKFTRTIVRLCKNKGECTYYEAKEQFDNSVLQNPEMFYNDWIICKVHRKHIL